MYAMMTLRAGASWGNLRWRVQGIFKARTAASWRSGRGGDREAVLPLRSIRELLVTGSEWKVGVGVLGFRSNIRSDSYMPVMDG